MDLNLEQTIFSKPANEKKGLKTVLTLNVQELLF